MRIHVRAPLSFAIPVGLFGVILLSSSAWSCGGQRAYIADDPTIYGEVKKSREGIRGSADQNGTLYVMKADLKISKGLADAVVRRYLDTKHPGSGHLHFEGFVYEHGRFVYMYDAEILKAYSVHVGPVQYVTRHLHIHVDAVTGNVYGPGCGGGPGQVDMGFDPSYLYPRELKDRWPPALQFDSEVVITDGRAPRIDGTLNPSEWSDAAHQKLRIGTEKETVTDYG